MLPLYVPGSAGGRQPGRRAGIPLVRARLSCPLAIQKSMTRRLMPRRTALAAYVRPSSSRCGPSTSRSHPNTAASSQSGEARDGECRVSCWKDHTFEPPLLCFMDNVPLSVQ